MAVPGNIYPAGKLIKPFWLRAQKVLKVLNTTPAEIYSIDPTQKRITGPNILNTVRLHATIAQINAGATLLSAIDNYRYRIVDMTMIAIGGAAAGATTVDVLATQSTSSVKLLAVAVAALTQSAVVRAGATNATVLADGASFAVCDENTAITVGKTGSNVTTATHVDFIVQYILEAV